MKTKLLLFALPLLLSGCVTGKGWQGILPGKDLDAINCTVTLSTPWGTETIHADRISSRIDPGANALAPLPAPNQNAPIVATPAVTKP
jgi:hypothetical protein